MTTTAPVVLSIRDEHERTEVLTVLATRLACRAEAYHHEVMRVAATHPSPKAASITAALAERESLRAGMRAVDEQIDELAGATLPATFDPARAGYTPEQFAREVADTIEAVSDMTRTPNDSRASDFESLYQAAGAAARLIARYDEQHEAA